MPEKDPSNYELITYAWVLGISMLGGIVSFLRKMRSGAARAFNIVEFIGEIVTSAFVGILTFYFCESAGISPVLTAAFVGISGHMGSRAIFMFEKKLERYFDGK